MRAASRACAILLTSSRPGVELERSEEDPETRRSMYCRQTSQARSSLEFAGGR